MMRAGVSPIGASSTRTFGYPSSYPCPPPAVFQSAGYTEAMAGGNFHHGPPGVVAVPVPPPIQGASHAAPYYR